MSLDAHFTPPPGEVLELSAAEVRDFRGKDPAKLRGSVTVSPPKGRCLVITRHLDEPDDRVCKPTVLTFSLGDLDRQGRLSWRVDGSEISWRTPYRVAITTPFDKKLEDPPVYRYVKACEPIEDHTGRRIRVALFDGETWTVRFPETDKLLSQPDPIPNLYVTVSGGKMSVAEAADASKKDGQAPAPASAAPAPAPAPETPKKKEDDVPLQPEDRAVWSVPRRGAYAMNGSYFQPYGSVAGGIKGTCRYNFTPPPEDPGTGRLECLDVEGFAHVLIPLTCLSALGPRT